MTLGVVFFRSESIQSAWTIFSGMTGSYGMLVAIPGTGGGLTFSSFAPEYVLLGLKGLSVSGFGMFVGMAAAISLWCRNSQEIVGVGSASAHPGSFGRGLFVGVLIVLVMGSLERESTFLYANF